MRARLKNRPDLEKSFQRDVPSGDTQNFVITVETPDGNQSTSVVGVTRVLAVVTRMLTTMDEDMGSSIKISFANDNADLDDTDPSPLGSSLQAELLEIARGE